MSKAELAKQEKSLPVKNQYSELLNTAVANNMDPKNFEMLVNLAWKQEDRLASQEFNRQLNVFQDKCPPIIKTKLAEFPTKKGGVMSYHFAPLDEVLKTIRPLLAELGFAISWDSDEKQGHMTTTCTLRHDNGHSVTAKHSSPIAGQGTPQQQGAGTLTFNKRYSLMQVLGIHAEDNDGQAPEVEKLSDDQCSYINTLLADLNDKKVNNRFKAWLGVESIEDIPASRYQDAKENLEDLTRKRNAK